MSESEKRYKQNSFCPKWVHLNFSVFGTRFCLLLVPALSQRTECPMQKEDGKERLIPPCHGRLGLGPQTASVVLGRCALLFTRISWRCHRETQTVLRGRKKKKKGCSSERQELPEEVLNISWDLPAPRDSSDPATFQNTGLENSLHLTGKRERLTSA